MCVHSNLVARSRNHCCSRKATMHSITAELHVAANYIKKLNIATTLELATFCLQIRQLEY